VLQRVLAVKDEKVGIVNGPGAPRDLSETSRDVGQGRWHQPRPRDQDAQRIDIIADRPPTHQASLDRRRAPSHEGIVDRVSRLRQALDEELGKLGLEACAIAHLVNRMSLPLPRRPELVDQVIDAAILDGHRRLPELAERPDEVNEGSGIGIARGSRIEHRLFEQGKCARDRTAHAPW
jgi:hypothetical protein